MTTTVPAPINQAAPDAVGGPWPLVLDGRAERVIILPPTSARSADVARLFTDEDAYLAGYFCCGDFCGGPVDLLSVEAASEAGLVAEDGTPAGPLAGYPVDWAACFDHRNQGVLPLAPALCALVHAVGDGYTCWGHFHQAGFTILALMPDVAAHEGAPHAITLTVQEDGAYTLALTWGDGIENTPARQQIREGWASVASSPLAAYW